LEKPKSRYSSKKLKKESLIKFVREKSLPAVGELTHRSESQYSSLPLPVVTVFADIDHEKNPKGYLYIVNRLRKVAKDYLGKIYFNIADTSDYSSDLKSYGIVADSKKKDYFVGLKSKSLYYKQDTVFSVDNVKGFIQKFLAGELVGIEKEVKQSSSSSSSS